MGFKTKTLVIFDWDDTLFPTTWVTSNNIIFDNLDATSLLYFSDIDKIISSIFSSIKEKIIIVTNASTLWVHKCINSVLPQTKKTTNLKIYSSRDMYQKTYPTDNFMWKKLFFEYIIKKVYGQRNFIPHIISVGDADYEYFALINLYAKDNNKIVKAIKLLRYPNKEDLCNELHVLLNVLPNCIESNKNLDISFRKV
jgi:hypothetical protein